MNTTDNITKTKLILDYKLRFKVEKSNKDLTDSSEKRIIGMIRELKKKMFVNSIYNDLRSRHSSLSFMYECVRPNEDSKT